MSYFRIAVGIPVKNYSFVYPYKWYSTLASSASVGDSSISVNSHLPAGGSNSIPADHFLRKGDIITLGSSTATCYSGKTETVIAKKVSSNTIYLESDLQNSYASSDSVSGDGTLCPDGWFPREGNTIYPKGIYQADRGKDNRFAMKVWAQMTGTPYMVSYFDQQFFENAFYYKLGFYYKASASTVSGSLDTYPFFTVNDGISSYETAFSYSGGSYEDTYSWTEKTYIFDTAAMCVERGSNPHLRVGIRRNSGSSEMTVWVDCVYIEHSDPTDTKTETITLVNSGGGTTSVQVLDTSGFSVGDTVLLSGIVPAVEAFPSGFDVAIGDRAKAEGTVSSVNANSNEVVINFNDAIVVEKGSTLRKKGNCYYQFPDYPELGSVQTRRLSSFDVNYIYGHLVGWSPAGEGERTEVWEVSMSFDKVSYSFYQSLKKFIEYLEKGNLLIFHLMDLIPEIEKPFLMGFLKLSQAKKDFWDRNKVSFQLSFTGY